MTFAHYHPFLSFPTTHIFIIGVLKTVRAETMNYQGGPPVFRRERQLKKKLLATAVGALQPFQC